MPEKHDNIASDTDDIAPDLAQDANTEFASIEELDNFEAELLDAVGTTQQDKPPNEKAQKTASQKTQEARPEQHEAQQKHFSENTQKAPEAPKAQPKNSRVPEPVNGRRPARKEDLIRNILQLQELVPGYTAKSKTFYARKKVGELQMILSDLTERGADSLQGVAPAQISKNSGNSEDPEIINAEDLPRVDGQPNPTLNAGEVLFAINLIVAQFCESVSVSYEDKIGTNLRGYTQDIVENRKELEACLSEIYAENAEMLNPYLTGTNRYFLMMTSLGGQRLVKNRVKKNASDEEDA